MSGRLNQSHRPRGRKAEETDTWGWLIILISAVKGLILSYISGLSI
jgi:hypothetical protein